MYELFEHTADLGLRVRAADLNSIFREAGLALFSAIIENPDAVQPLLQSQLTIAGDDREFLLFDWLRELLSRFETDHWLLSDCSVDLNDTGLTATIRGEFFDATRHELTREVKAITYHELKIQRLADGWVAEVIVDI